MPTWLLLFRANRLLASKLPENRTKALDLLSNAKHPAAAASIVNALASLAREESAAIGPERKALMTLKALAGNALERAWAKWPTETKHLVVSPIHDRSELSLHDVWMLKHVHAVDVLVDVVAGKYGSKASAWGASALREIGDRAVHHHLVALLLEGTAAVRHSVAYSCGDLGWSEMIEPLDTALRDPNESVRAGAAWSLGQFDSIRAVGPLIAALSDNSARVREEAAQSLWRIGNEAASQALIETIDHDSDTAVRSAAVRALGTAGTRLAIPHLIKRIEKLSLEDNSVYALAALEELVLRIAHELSDEDLSAICSLKSGRYHHGPLLPEGGSDFHDIKCSVVVWLAHRESRRREGTPGWLLNVPEWLSKERGSEYARKVEARLKTDGPPAPRWTPKSGH